MAKKQLTKADPPTKPVKVCPLDAWTLLIATVRYSLGRQTYMTWLAPELVLRYADALLPSQLEQIAEEIETEVASYMRRFPPDRIPDEESWLRHANQIRSRARR
jgi:hypothetical protein